MPAGNVVDTNVLVIANNRDTNACEKCILNAMRYLRSLVNEKKLVLLDEKGEIFKEYRDYCNFRGQPGVGDAFFKWLHDKQGDPAIVAKIEITPSENQNDGIKYEELRPFNCLDGFDPSDQKFLAVAVKFEGDSVIYNATDSDWNQFADCIASIPLVEVHEICAGPKS